jgi:hypothetical protein
VFRATGIRLAELAGIRYDASDPRRSDVDLWQREITVRGKGGKPRIVKITCGAARLDLAPDAPPLRRQRPQCPRSPHLRPHHER